MMKLKDAIQILMRSGSNDVIGQGCGIRSTTDEWREQVAEAWYVCFKYLNKREPYDSELHNAGISYYLNKEKINGT